jgi:hypothetical protein
VRPADAMPARCPPIAFAFKNLNDCPQRFPCPVVSVWCQVEPIRVVTADQLAMPAGGTPCFEKLNRLPWSRGFSFSSHGVAISVRSNDPQCLDALCTRLPAGAVGYSGLSVDLMFSLWVPAVATRPGVRQFTLLYINDGLVARDLDCQRVMHHFDQRARLAVAALAPERVFLHAGVVGWTGRAVIMPGPSRSGKSELVRALLRLGATYYSDEYAVIGPAGEVEPYPRPLSIRRHSNGQPYTVSSQQMGAQIGSDPIPAGLLLFSQYDRHADWRPRRLSPAEAAVGLISNAVAACVSPELVLPQVCAISRQVPAFETPRGEAHQVAALVLQAIEDAGSRQPSDVRLT